ncbi:MAG: bifunctional fucokinase/L-fucose-1-P-guanylyltransferase, partial [Kiritimatiellae bacterium]|nr:bifunctional fucokinase/L-fucose-1-P-guanylyltransferase [Kiritimatiellia bacterium]
RGPAEIAADAMVEDLARAAASGRPLPPPPPDTAPPLALVHDAMYRETATGKKRSPDAFALLRDLLVGDMALSPVRPARNVLENQIVWGRAPARLDLAGGWSDTPPYCLEHGGRVVNLAVDLNGQPPIQAFASVCAEPCIRIHSIDLGLSETFSTYEELCRSSELGSFSIPRAAVRLAGFDPRFASGAAPTLREQLSRTMGGGLEISMLAAIPKGSGLGTSSILAATILGVLGEICALGWTPQDLFARTTVLEQLLGSGGGWQDQLGGVLPGAKLAVTRPGVRQTPDVRYLPEGMLDDLVRSGRALLYYTGVTRVARSILADIVRGIFLDDRRVLSCIEDIACNADFAADAIQRADEAGLAEALRRSWDLNRELDSGTCPESLLPITSVMERCGAAYKLLGAGGGGYIFAVAPDTASAAAIRETLTRRPPNPGARFVAVSLSRGLQITRS